jgi:hypothetical protein
MLRGGGSNDRDTNWFDGRDMNRFDDRDKTRFYDRDKTRFYDRDTNWYLDRDKHRFDDTFDPFPRGIRTRQKRLALPSRHRDRSN